MVYKRPRYGKVAKNIVRMIEEEYGEVFEIEIRILARGRVRSGKSVITGIKTPVTIRLMRFPTS